MIGRTSHLGHAGGSGSLSGIPTPPLSRFAPAAPSTPIRVRRESCQSHLASLQVDEEQHIVGRQPFERQDFRREEVHSHQDVKVCADKALP